MRIFLLVFLFMAFTVGISAQTAAKIKLQNPGSGKILLIRGKTRATIALTKDVAGCADGNAAIKKEFKDCAAGSADFKLIDAAVKDNRTYLVISSTAAGNCNVCGQCGADEAIGLIWLKLDRNLRLLDKKSAALDYCRFDIALISDILDFNEETQEKILKPVFTNDVLTIDFEQKIFEENSDRSHFEFSHLEYDRKTPEKGFVIKTERREKSSVTEQ